MTDLTGYLLSNLQVLKALKSMMELYGHDFDPAVFEWERIN